MNKKNLKIRPVTGEDVEQYNALLRYVFQVTDQQLRSVGWKEKEFIQAKFPNAGEGRRHRMVRRR